MLINAFDCILSTVWKMKCLCHYSYCWPSLPICRITLELRSSWKRYDAYKFLITKAANNYSRHVSYSRNLFGEMAGQFLLGNFINCGCSHAWHPTPQNNMPISLLDARGGRHVYRNAESGPLQNIFIYKLVKLADQDVEKLALISLCSHRSLVIQWRSLPEFMIFAFTNHI